MLTNKTTVPLFPLHTVLFPDGVLPLRIFEPRYLDMISHCLKNDHDFGICLIRQGRETGQAAMTHKVGTLAKIIDWNQLPDGFLGIQIKGQQKFKVIFQQVKPNHLIEAEINPLPNEVAQEIPSTYSLLSNLLEKIIAQTNLPHQNHLTVDYNNATWVSHRLAELLPMSLKQQQYLLELNDPIQRLDILDKLLKFLRIAPK